jgi:plasmid replication initiation protein
MAGNELSAPQDNEPDEELLALPHLSDEALKALVLDENGDPIDTTTPATLKGSLTMSRALAESSHGLTLNESRVMMLAMRCVDPRKSPYKYARDGFVKVRVSAAEFAELANLEPNSDGYTPRAAYEGLKAACDKIFERTASWNEGKTQVKMRWVFKAQYHEGEAWAEICFSPDMTRHIFMLGERFVRYRLELARGLRSIYSSNLLRLLMTQKDTGFKTITLEDFRKTMEVPESYRYGDIKRYAIVAPVKELNDKADMRIEWKETKRGRSVHSLQFTFEMLRPEDKGRQAELDI